MYDGGTPQTVASGADFTVTLPAPVTGTKLLRIYDPSFTGTPNDDAGKITISGTLGSSTAQLRILIAGPSESWPAGPLDDLATSGVRSLGVDANDGIVISDADLRLRTRLAAFTSADINGTIDVGQVQRVQCGPAATSPLGTINADITARTLDFVFDDELPTNRAITYISAGDAINGTITAAGDAAIYNSLQRNTFGSIGTAFVGPNLGADGIQGDLLAELGGIDKVHTTGPIGATNDLKKIWAGSGITEVRAFDGTDGYLDVDFHADIDSARNFETASSDPSTQGGCRLIETGGDVHGAIHAGNWLAPHDDVFIRRGLYARGNVTADIEVDLIAECNFIAARFLGSIEIGYMFEGSIIATAIDDATAVTPLVSIGYGAADATYDALLTLRGFSGSANEYGGCPSINPRNAAQIETFFTDFFICDGEGLVPSLIALPSVAEMNIASMTSFELAWWEQPEPPYSRAPSIEVASIGSLTVGMLREGAIWSGYFDDDSVPPTDAHPSDDYAIVGEINIGCIGQGGRLWVHGFDRLIVGNSMDGEIQVPNILAGKLLVIGDELGAFDSDLGCNCDQTIFDCDDAIWDPVAEPNESPRSSTRFAVGKIVVDGDLAEQILINGNGAAAPDPAEYWAGSVTARASQSTAITLAPGSPSPDTAPYYVRLPAALGGGAAGLEPGHLHDWAGFPDPDDSHSFFSSSLSHQAGVPPETIVLVFYVPVKAESSASPLTIMYTGPGAPMDLTPFFQVEFGPTVNGVHSREIRIHGTDSRRLMTGIYEISPNLTGSNRLLCANLLTTENVAVGEDFVLEIEIKRDCNGNLTEDEDDEECPDLTPPIGVPDCCHLCDADFNCDGNVDQDDVGCIIDVVAGNPGCECQDADYNQDGNVDQDDVAALINSVAGGGCP